MQGEARFVVEPDRPTGSLVVRLVVGRRGWGRRGPRDPLDEARSILAQRFARGEIDAEEYRGRVAELRN